VIFYCVPKLFILCKGRQRIHKLDIIVEIVFRFTRRFVVIVNDKYIPGVCNIGPAEINRRKRGGWVGVGVTILLWLAFWALRVPAAWRLTLFFPAFLSAEGFLQAALHFCAGFGMRGVFNFGAEVGKTETVEQAEFRRKDLRKARLISLYSALIGIAIAMLGYLL
jgi:hypothetical protein